MLSDDVHLSFISGWLTWLNPPEGPERKFFCMAHSGIFTVSTNEKQKEIILRISISEIKSVKQNESDIINSSTENGSYIYLFTIYFEQDFYKFGYKSLTQVKKWVVVLTPQNYNHYNLKTLQLSDFIIISKIGSGYSGEVLLAKHKETSKYYALKSIPKENIQESKITQAISERNILMEASHPFITRLISTFQTDKKLYLVLEYVQGGDLLFHLNKSQFFISHDKKLYLAEIATALSYLHRLGVIFRDLKPSNILIGKDGHMKLTDFGLSRYLIVDHNNRNKKICFSFCGTNEYMAPEMIQGTGYGFSVDWWSFGVLAYLMYQGVLPFRSLNLTKLFNQITTSTIKFFTKLNDAETDFISRLLSKDPEKRLGCGANGENEIFEHPFFSDIVWKDVYDKKYTPNFRPYSGSNEGITCACEGCSSDYKVNDEKRSFSNNFKDFSFTNYDELSHL